MDCLKLDLRNTSFADSSGCRMHYFYPNILLIVKGKNISNSFSSNFFPTLQSISTKYAASENFTDLRFSLFCSNIICIASSGILPMSWCKTDKSKSSSTSSCEPSSNIPRWTYDAYYYEGDTSQPENCEHAN